jgi:L-alanine-DL-glutamate epimerase-like enolase superfamily enzyme
VSALLLNMIVVHAAGAAAELANVGCIFHGHHGMDLIGALQVGATIRSATMQEIVFTTPGILPEEAWSPLAALVKTPHLLKVTDGIVKIPTAPGLGIEVDEEAVERYRVSDDGATLRT